MSTLPHIKITAAPGIADPSADEAAAAVAAIVSLMAEAASPQDSDGTSEPVASWHDATKLSTQGIVPSRTPAKPGWGRIERIRRAGKGGSGITGL
ncbi:MAG: hypothetical protein WCI67_07990 [Chloroflexales bacterium]